MRLDKLNISTSLIFQSWSRCAKITISFGMFAFTLTSNPKIFHFVFVLPSFSTLIFLNLNNCFMYFSVGNSMRFGVLFHFFVNSKFTTSITSSIVVSFSINYDQELRAISTRDLSTFWRIASIIISYSSAVIFFFWSFSDLSFLGHL